MVVAPALGVACPRALSWLCLLTAALAAAVVAKYGFAPDGRLDVRSMVALAGVFAAGAAACHWGAALLRRAAR